MISYGKCTKAQYEALTPVQDRIYFLTDTGEQFLNGLPYNGEDNKDYLCLTAETDGATVGLKYDATPSAYPIVWHSADRRTWTAFEWTGNATDVATLANAGDKVYLRAFNGGFGNTAAESTNLKFSMTGTIAASGNIMSLLHGDDFETRSEVPAFGFQNLFRGCASLVEPPEMPAIRLGVRAYYCMFYGCALRHCPELPARTLTQACYGSMFGGGHQQFAKAEIGASSFEADPDFPLSEMAPLNKMFKGCASLATVTAHFELWSTTDIGTVATNWLQNTAATGVFKCPSTLDTTTRDASHVPAGWSVIYTDIEASKTIPSATASDAGKVLTVNASGTPEWDAAQGGGGGDPLDYFCVEMVGDEQTELTFQFVGTSGSPIHPELEYSFDKRNWTACTWTNNYTMTPVSIASKGKVWLRGNNETFAFAFGAFAFRLTSNGLHKVSGNIMSLLDKTCKKTTLQGGDFVSLFKNDIKLVSAKDLKLPATSVPQSAYQSMFYQCSELQDAPELPATSVGSYGYAYMFYQCSSLVSAQAKLAIDSVDERAFAQMYLETPIVAAPCISFAPNAVINQHWGDGMFSNCSSLKWARVENGAGINGDYTSNWMNGVASVGYIEFNQGAITAGYAYGASGLPSGWNTSPDGSNWSDNLQIDSTKTLETPFVKSICPNTNEVLILKPATGYGNMLIGAYSVPKEQVAYAPVIVDYVQSMPLLIDNSLTLVDQLVEGKRNHCVIRWSNGVAKLFVVDTEDIPQ